MSASLPETAVGGRHPILGGRLLRLCILAEVKSTHGKNGNEVSSLFDPRSVSRIPHPTTL